MKSEDLVLTKETRFTFWENSLCFIANAMEFDNECAIIVDCWHVGDKFVYDQVHSNFSFFSRC